MRTRAWAGLALVALSFARTAAAQPARVVSAAERFDLAVRLATEGDLRAALVEFRAAFDGSQNPAVLFNIAAVHERLNEYVEAEETLARYERLAAPREFVAHRAQVVAALARLRSRIGTLRVVVEAPGATCALDGVPRAVADLRAGLRASAGRHALRCEAEGYDPAARDVDVRGLDATEVTLAPARRSGSLSVTASVEGAEVRVDGALVGTTPLPTPLRVEEGSRRVEVRLVGHERVTADVIVRGAARLDATLRWRDPVPDAEGAWLVVRTSEPGATITVDGRRVAVDGSQAVPPGRRRLRVERRLFTTVERDVDLALGARRLVEVQLAPTQGFRASWVADAQARRRRWVAVLSAGAAAAVAGGVWFGLTTAAWLDADARFEENQRLFNGCGTTACPLSRAEYGARRDLAAEETASLIPQMGVAAGLTVVGVGAVIAGVVLAAGAPDPQRFERAPTWHIGLGGAGVAVRF